MRQESFSNFRASSDVWCNVKYMKPAFWDFWALSSFLTLIKTFASSVSSLSCSIFIPLLHFSLHHAALSWKEALGDEIQEFTAGRLRQPPWSFSLGPPDAKETGSSLSQLCLLCLLRGSSVLPCSYTDADTMRFCDCWFVSTCFNLGFIGIFIVYFNCKCP